MDSPESCLTYADSHFDYSRPARTLLEASARRVAQHAHSDSGDRDQAGSALQQTALIVSFMAAYAAAAAAGTANWATFSDVKDMFADDAVLVTQDRQVFKGKQQVLRRLDQGVHAVSPSVLGINVIQFRPVRHSFRCSITGSFGAQACRC